jgi:hypothetical protein
VSEPALEQTFRQFDAQRQYQSGLDAMATAFADEAKRLSQADPLFAKLSPLIGNLAADGIEQTDQAAEAAIRVLDALIDGDA